MMGAKGRGLGEVTVKVIVEHRVKRGIRAQIDGFVSCELGRVEVAGGWVGGAFCCARFEVGWEN
jgi:hypothetical protein